MHDAGLDRRFREHRVDRFGEALQAVDHGDQDVLHAAQLQVVHHPQPELGALGLLDPKAEHVACAVAAHAQRQVDRLVAHHAFVADLDSQGVEEHDRVHRLERSLLPFAHFVDHGISHRADEVRRHLDAIHLQQETLNLPHAHAAGIHRDDLVVEACEASLALGDRYRIKGAFAVARNLDVEQVIVGCDALAAGAVAMVRAARRLGFALLVAQVVGQFAAQRALEYRLLQGRELLVDRSPIQRSGHQLLDKFRVQVQALTRFYRHFFLAFAWHNVAPWPSVYASHTKVRIGSLGSASARLRLGFGSASAWLRLGFGFRFASA
ncbi:hypothetical protein IST4119_00738 [Burkholderia multivorans]|nr:hypothetical protein IST4119_00738 [Burkholderia multivorans]